MIDGTGADAREDVGIVMADGLIETVLPWHALETQGGVEVIDHSGATVVPGLIDGHAHLCWGSPASQAWADLPDESAALVCWGLASGAAALGAGITTVVDCGSPAGYALSVRDLVRSGVAEGPLVVAAAEAITTTGGHGEFIGATADSARELAEMVEEHVRRGADLIKVMVTGGATDPQTNRRRAQYSTEELRVVVTNAHRHGRVVVGHANATEGIMRAVQAGFDVIAHCNWLGPEPGTVVMDLPTVHSMARSGTSVDLNVEGARRPLARSDGRLVGWPLEGPEPRTRWELLRPLRDSNVPIHLSSDAFGPAIGSFPSQLGAAAAQWNLSAEQVVASVTVKPATALGLHRRGVIRDGHVADLAAFGGDMRADLTALGRPVVVYRFGRRVAQDGLLMPPAVARGHRREARAQMRLLEEVFDELV